MTDPLDTINKALIVASQRRDLQGVKKALESGANINNSQWCYGIGTTTALGASACCGNWEVLQYLVEAGANPYLPFRYPTLSDVARRTNHEMVAKYLDEIMKRPKWLNKIDEGTGYTPLTYAILHSAICKVEVLVDSGADVCKMDRHGKTPLLYALDYSSEIAKILLEKGASAVGVTAIQRALELRRNDVLKCIFDNKYPIIDVFLDDGSTPLTKAISTCNVEIAKYLIEFGADPEKSDLNGDIPLEKALEVECVEIAEMLVLKGAKVPKSIKQPLFHKIAEDGNIPIYEFFIKNQWDVNQVDEDGKSALAFSASNENLLLSRLLIENGANIALAQTEVEAFKKQNTNFNWFMEQIIAKKIRSECQTGQE